MSISEKKKMGEEGGRQAASICMCWNRQFQMWKPHCHRGWKWHPSGRLYSRFYSRRVDTTWRSAHWLTWTHARTDKRPLLLAPAGCQAQSLDLVFLLDASASVGPENFAQMQAFIRKCTLRFDVNPDVTQVGLVVYGSQVQTAFGLDTYSTRAAVLRVMSQAPYLGGVGSAGTALLHIDDKVMTIQRGARPGVPKAVVMITGGSGAEDAAVPAQKLRSNGISVLVVSVGAVVREAVRRLAGPRDSLIHVAAYADLRYHQDALTAWLCRGEWEKGRIS